MTDNRVWVDQDGREMVAANRSDSLGLSYLRQAGVPHGVDEERFAFPTERGPRVFMLFAQTK